MSETERRQTTKGIWLSKNKMQAKSATADGPRMADNILVMDVEGTDGRERGEDQDFERKSALFALATSEVLIVNIWEHQVGLYQGANMGLLKTVFEVNLQLFLKDKQYADNLDPSRCALRTNGSIAPPTDPYYSSLFVISSVPPRSRTSKRHYWKTSHDSGTLFPNPLDWKGPQSTITLISNSTGSRTKATNRTSSYQRPRS
jgi:hypothetical protein